MLRKFGRPKVIIAGCQRLEFGYSSDNMAPVTREVENTTINNKILKIRKEENTLKTKLLLKLMLTASVLCGGSNAWAQTVFNYTGASQDYIVPPGVVSVQIEAWGGQGQALTIEDYDGSTGGLGGYATGELAVTPGETLTIFVGGAGADGVAGFNGGGLGGVGTPTTGGGGFAGSGGGASDVRAGGTALTDRVIVAGGGGGGGRDYVNGSCVPCGTGGNGGGGGGLTGTDGEDPAGSGFLNPGAGGEGGTPSAGGAGGDGPEGIDGNPGALGIGGNGIPGSQSVASGGAGGGYYGGGAGAGANNGSGDAGGGGAGGSSYIGGLISGSTTAAQNIGDGRITITAAESAEPNEIPTLNIYGLMLLSLMMVGVVIRRTKNRR